MPSTRVYTPKLAEEWREVVGDKNCEEMKRALEEGAKVWVFLTEKEIDDAASELSCKDRIEIKRILREEKLGYAGWIQRKQRTVLGFYYPRGLESH